MSETETEKPGVKHVDPDEFREVNIGEEINAQTQPPSEQGKAEVFDPAIHCSNPDGSPRRNVNGTFRKKPLQKSKENGAKTVETEVIEDNFNCPAPPSSVQMVEMVLGLATMLAVSQLGEEWKPVEEERKMLVDVWARYAHYRGWDLEASPEMILVGATLAYLMPRIMSPKFLARFKRVESNAYTGDRTNGNGQNNAGENNSTPINRGGEGSDRIRPPIERMG